MPMFTIDDVEYNTEDLSDNGKAQLASLQFLEVQMSRLKNELCSKLANAIYSIEYCCVSRIWVGLGVTDLGWI